MLASERSPFTLPFIIPPILYYPLWSPLWSGSAAIGLYQAALPKDSVSTTPSTVIIINIHKARIIRYRYTKHQAIKTYWGSEGIAPCILNLGTIWRRVVSFTNRPVCRRGKNARYPLNRSLRGVAEQLKHGNYFTLLYLNCCIHTFPSYLWSFNLSFSYKFRK
jgi:hypothetical protein